MEDYKIPVYLITGFLESGKTSFIQFTIQQDYFADGEKTLLIACEEGEEEYDFFVNSGLFHKMFMFENRRNRIC